MVECLAILIPSLCFLYFSGIFFDGCILICNGGKLFFKKPKGMHNMYKYHKHNVQLKKPDTKTIWFLLHKVQRQEKKIHNVRSEGNDYPQGRLGRHHRQGFKILVMFPSSLFCFFLLSFHTLMVFSIFTNICIISHH